MRARPRTGARRRPLETHPPMRRMLASLSLSLFSLFFLRRSLCLSFSASWPKIWRKKRKEFGFSSLALSFSPIFFVMSVAGCDNKPKKSLGEKKKRRKVMCVRRRIRVSVDGSDGAAAAHGDAALDAGVVGALRASGPPHCKRTRVPHPALASPPLRPLSSTRRFSPAFFFLPPFVPLLLA